MPRIKAGRRGGRRMKNEKNYKDFSEVLKKIGDGKIVGEIVFEEKTITEKKKDKNKMSIDISKETQMGLDNLRREIVEIISQTNDLDLMKRIEKCSYDKLVLLLNVGFSEKAFYDTLNGNVEMKAEDIFFTEKSKEVLIKLLEEKKEDGRKNDRNGNEGKDE